MAFFLGFDVSKLKLDTSFIDEVGNELWHGKVPNNGDAIAEYLLGVHGNHGGFTAVVEATSVYHHALLDACVALDIPIRVYNPILTKQMVNATIRGVKTDRTDALHIARLGLRGAGRLYVPEPYLPTKHAGRALHQLAEFTTAFRLHETHVREVLGSDLSQEAGRLLAEMHVLLRSTKRRLARDMVASTPADLRERLQTIPGVGPAVACSLIGEIQDMARFTNANSLVAFAGLDPKIRQSGTALNHAGHLSKRGSPHLRRYLFCAAFVARQHDPYFKALYERKRSEGRSYTEACCAVSRKLLVTVRAVWLGEKDYDAACAASPQQRLDRDM